MKYTLFPLLIVFAFILFSCDKPIPRPKGYFRIDVPKRNVVAFDVRQLPYSFGISNVSNLKYDTTGQDRSWLVIEYPRYKAKVLCTYKTITPTGFRAISEENRDFVYRHTVKASAIDAKLFENPERRVYGVFYDLKGEAATPCQFMLTDSVHHYFRGSLYFDCAPQPDSLAPVVKYIKEDILDLMKTFSWK
ncbi:MAG: gliding motility lipoprotein GldD [Bacteroidota bacterium]|nr:gliding motility lipoprotein GldD [Bacteroidota bacterium]